MSMNVRIALVLLGSSVLSACGAAADPAGVAGDGMLPPGATAGTTGTAGVGVATAGVGAAGIGAAGSIGAAGVSGARLM
jgi:hypothetical protein